MAESQLKSHAIPEAESDKKQGDKLAHVLDQGADHTQHPAAEGGPTPQTEPLK